jgi:hypothetical protein
MTQHAAANHKRHDPLARAAEKANLVSMSMAPVCRQAGLRVDCACGLRLSADGDDKARAEGQHVDYIRLRHLQQICRVWPPLADVNRSSVSG